MRYPTNIDISLVIRHALHMKSPKIYERPAGAMIFLSSPKHQPSQQQHSVMRSTSNDSASQKYSTLPIVHQRRITLEHPLQTRSSQAAAIVASEERQRTHSLPRNTGSLRKATAGELREVACLATKQAITNSAQAEIRDPTVTDGYREDVSQSFIKQSNTTHHSTDQPSNSFHVYL